MEQYSVWAPRAESVVAHIDGDDHEMSRVSPGSETFALSEPMPVPGARYGFRVDGGEVRPGPRSVSQPDGVHALSEVVDLDDFEWTDLEWPGRDLRGAVIYELHIGTFSEAGTFDGAISRLDHLVELGVDAVELLPVAAFPGERGWGYDGVSWYAAFAPYGGPRGLQRFVDAAHARGLSVVLDVVYNHFGPAGNYSAEFGPYVSDAHLTPWGAGLNVDGPGSRHVREFVLDNLRQWAGPFHVDGFRLDAVHEIADDSPRHLLAEIADEMQHLTFARGRPVTLIAESDRNNPATVTPTASASDGATDGLGMDAQWADDVHHAIHAWLTGERQGYYVDFGTAAALAKVLTRVFLHDGGYSTFRGQNWGRPVDPISPSYDGHVFVAFMQDHDQIGNRATGDRITATISPGRQAIGAALLLTSALTPMLFMGEEFAASTPWAFFSDHDDELGPQVTQGRTEEFAAMDWDREVPDPQAESTFLASKLDWSELDAPDHAAMLDWYRTLLALRRENEDLRDGDLAATEAEAIGDTAIHVRRGMFVIVANCGSAALEVPLPERSSGALAASWGEAGVGADGRALSVGPDSVGILRLDSAGSA